MIRVILASGGLDSSVAIAAAMANRDKVLVLGFDYNNDKQYVRLHALQMFSGYYLLEPKILPIMTELFTDDGFNVPAKPDGIIPILVASAMAYAQTNMADTIVLATNKDDLSDMNNIITLQGLVSVATGKKVSLELPFLTMTKEEIINLGVTLNVPFNLMMYCENTVNPPCGSCNTCKLMDKLGVTHA